MKADKRFTPSGPKRLATLMCAVFTSVVTALAALSAVGFQDAAAPPQGVSREQNAQERLKVARAAARDAPRSAEVRNELGLVLGEAGDLTGAIAEFEAATRLDKGFAQADYNLGITYLKRAKLAQARDDPGYYSDLDNALQAFRRASKLAPHLSQIHDTLGWLDLEIGDFKDAPEEFSLAVQEAPRSAEAYNFLGTALGRAGKLEEACQAYEKAVQLNPHYVAAGLSLGVSIQRHLPQTLEARRAMVQRQPASALSHMLLGQALLFSHREPEATVELRQALKLDSTMAIANYYLGRMELDSGDLPGAAVELRQAISLSPDTSEFRLKLGLALLQQNKVDPSLTLLKEVTQQSPNDYSARYVLARALQKTGHREEAGKEFHKADELQQAEKDRRVAGSYVIVGIQNLRTGKTHEAVEALRQAVARSPDYPEANYYLGIALAQSGDGEGCVRAFQQALRAKPRSAEIHYNYGVALWQMGKMVPAIEEFGQALEINPNDGLAHCALGKALLHENDEEAGQKELERAQKLGACKADSAASAP